MAAMAPMSIVTMSDCFPTESLSLGVTDDVIQNDIIRVTMSDNHFDRCDTPYGHTSRLKWTAPFGGGQVSPLVAFRTFDVLQQHAFKD
eukprot:1335970-Amorphochlora_amoeboformis.AAC.1